MKWIAVLSTTLWTGFSGPCFAMGGPVYVDTACETMRVAEASPAVKDWLKREMREGRAPQGLERFVKDVAANNENWRRKCGGR